MCKKTIIAQKDEISITQCTNCKVVNIWKPGVLLSFSFDQFEEFVKVSENIDFDDYLEYSPAGNEVVVLSTPFEDIHLMFTRPELDSFVATMVEALYMQKIYQLMNAK